MDYSKIKSLYFEPASGWWSVMYAIGGAAMLMVSCWTFWTFPIIGFYLERDVGVVFPGYIYPMIHYGLIVTGMLSLFVFYLGIVNKHQRMTIVDVNE